MDAFTVLVVVSIVLFDICCVLFIRKQLFLGIKEVVEKIEKIIEE